MRKSIKNLLVIVVAVLFTSVCAYAHSEYSVSGAMITAYNGNEDVVTVPAIIDGVMIAGIDTGAFQNKAMHTVIIEEGIEVIQPRSFVGCSNLEYVKSPESMLLINEDAFFECSSQLQLDVSGNTYVMDMEQSAGLLEETEEPGETEETEDEDYNGFLYLENTIIGYIGEETDIIIPEIINDVTITSIEASAFEGNTLITSVIMPDTITTIGASAFKGCTSLAEVSLSENLSSAGNEAFSGCSSLKTITIPGALTIIPKNMFYDCSSLSEVTLENGVTRIRDYAFYSCANMVNINVPETLTRLDTWVFGFCKKLKTFYIPDSCTIIDSAVFYYCSALNNIIIPDTVTSIVSHCFRACSSLSNLTLSKNLQSIPYRALNGCAFTSLEIPDKVTSIGSEAFYQCSKLKNIEIPASVTSIESAAFYGCTSLDMMIVYGTNTTTSKIFTHNGNTSKGPNTTLYVVTDSATELSAQQNELPYKSITGTANVVKTYISINNAEKNQDNRTSLVFGDNVYAKHTVVNVGANSQNLQLIICLYDENGRFMKFACSPSKSVAVNGFEEIEVSMQIDFEPSDSTEPDNNDEATLAQASTYYAKVFMVDGLLNFSPLCESKEI